jgi:hypothetical protein
MSPWDSGDKFATPFGSVHDDAAHGRRVLEQAGRSLDVAVSQKLPDPRGRDAAIALEPHVFYEVHSEVVHLTEAPQGVDVTGSTNPETEITADEHNFRVQRVDQDARDELLGRLVGECPVERHHEGGVDPCRREEFELSLGADEGGGAAARRQEFEWMAVERHDDALEVVAGRDIEQLPDDGPVARVNAVELADGHGGTSPLDRYGGEVGEDLHDALSSPARAGLCARSQSMPSTGRTRGMKR